MAREFQKVADVDLITKLEVLVLVMDKQEDLQKSNAEEAATYTKLVAEILRRMRNPQPRAMPLTHDQLEFLDFFKRTVATANLDEKLIVLTDPQINMLNSVLNGSHLVPYGYVELDNGSAAKVVTSDEISALYSEDKVHHLGDTKLAKGWHAIYHSSSLPIKMYAVPVMQAHDEKA